MGSVDWGSVGEWVSGIGALAGTGVALGIAIHGSKQASKMAAKADRENIRREASSIRWDDSGGGLMEFEIVSIPDDPGHAESKYTALAIIENGSTRALYNLKATLIVDGKPFGEPMPMGPNGDGSGVAPAHGGRASARLPAPANMLMSPKFRFGFDIDQYRLVINEHGDISISDFP